MNNQPEYIKREDAKELIRSYCKDLISEGKCDVEVTEFNSDIQNKLSELPAADVAEVVRCKDCKYRNTPDCFIGGYDDTGEYFSYAKDDDFCSYGKQVTR